jgi:hypothetical protein
LCSAKLGEELDVTDAGDEDKLGAELDVTDALDVADALDGTDASHNLAQVK